MQNILIKNSKFSRQSNIFQTFFSYYSNVTFNYTLNNSKLNIVQRNDYEKNGFLVVKGLIAEKELDKFESRFKQICIEKLKITGMTVMKDISIVKSEFLEGEKAITKLQDFCFDDQLFKYCCLPELVEYIESFTGPNIMAMHTMLINKPPGKI
jgi:phytanoyl-CoA hydroxylase